MTSLVAQLRHDSGIVIRPVFGRAPTSVLDVSQGGLPWRWTSVLVAPLEVVAVAWSVPLVILAVMLPVGLSVSSLLWLGRQIISRF
jgi:hypothetical protein